MTTTWWQWAGEHYWLAFFLMLASIKCICVIGVTALAAIGNLNSKDK